MKRKNQVGIWFLFSFAAVILVQYGLKCEKSKEYTEIPDMISSISYNNDYHLKVVANNEYIEDLEEFAREIIHMCQDNSFHTVKFSTGMKGYPERLDIDVYLQKNDIETKEPVCRIRFESNEPYQNYDIKNHADMFRLYLDEKEIPYY